MFFFSQNIDNRYLSKKYNYIAIISYVECIKNGIPKILSCFAHCNIILNMLYKLKSLGQKI